MPLPTAPPPTLGVILAGGLARRMGGGDKPMREIAGRPMLDRVVDRLGPQCVALVLNANGDADRFARSGLPVVADGVPGFAGPLAGILAGLDWTAAHRPDIAWVVTAAADTPFLPRDFVARLHAAREGEAVPLACAETAGRTHPANALWPVALRADLRRALVEEGERKIDRWTIRYGVAAASWPVGGLDPFFNVNSPEDLAVAEDLALLDQASDA